jgi:hypothetical protein
MIVWGFGCFLAAGIAWAQNGYVSKPYLVAAEIDIAVDNQADLWLNGILIKHCRHTLMETGCQRVAARPDSLCYFKNTNVLAIRVQGSKSSQGDGFIGVAYAFRFQLSDGTYRVVDSSSPDDHRCFYLPRRGVDEPDGWKEIGFDDSRWLRAQSSGDMIPNTASLSGGDSGGVAGFLTATSKGYSTQYPGEKQLFRRRFDLDIAVNPRCLPKGSMTAPSFLWSDSVPTRGRTARPPTTGTVMSITPEVLPVHREPLASLPQLNYPAYRRGLPVLKPQIVWPTFTPAVNGFSPSVLVPLYIANTPTPTPQPVVFRPRTRMPMDNPAPTPTVIVQDDGAIVFGRSKANLLVSFGDGPGFYKVEAVDEYFNHLKTILDQHVLDETQIWLTWDGKDEGGKDAPPGCYYILCSKEGMLLQKIILRRIP